MSSTEDENLADLKEWWSRNGKPLVTGGLFALVIVLLIIGVVIGGTAAWLRHGRWRRVARRLERDLKELNARLHALQGASAEPGIVPREQEPPPRLKLRPPSRV